MAVRNIRRDANDVFKKKNKSKEITDDDFENISDDIQKVTDKYIQKIDKAVEVKSKELLTV